MKPKDIIQIIIILKKGEANKPYGVTYDPTDLESIRTLRKELKKLETYIKKLKK